jgi:acyl phosphate:glycerol-3-phosphate acyltransferase
VPAWSYIVVAVAAYLLGSIPTGFLVAKAKGIDIREIGSGNIGAANTFRAIGKFAGIFVLLVDAAKGFLACVLGAFVCIYFANQLNGLHSITDSNSNSFDEAFNSLANVPIIAGIFAVLGHNYTCWLKFKGGKGIATSAGVYLALAPAALCIALGVFVATVITTRFASLASILAAIVMTFAVWFTNENWILRLVTIALCALAIFKHRKNIQRLMAGTENQIEFGKRDSLKR